MDELGFPEINRSVLIVKFKLPYAGWIKELSSDSDDDELTLLQELNIEPATYLIPEILDDEDLERYLAKSWRLIFAAALNEWTLDRDLWPKKLTRELFNQWLDLQCHPLVLDLCKEPLDYVE